MSSTVDVPESCASYVFIFHSTPREIAGIAMQFYKPNS
jgi:hypothetical protein